jgi:hypothetical protein
MRFFEERGRLAICCPQCCAALLCGVVVSWHLLRAIGCSIVCQAGVVGVSDMGWEVCVAAAERGRVTCWCGLCTDYTDRVQYQWYVCVACACSSGEVLRRCHEDVLCSVETLVAAPLMAAALAAYVGHAV